MTADPKPQSDTINAVLTPLAWIYVAMASLLGLQAFLGLSMTGFRPPIHPVAIGLLAQPFLLMGLALWSSRSVFLAVSGVCFVLTACLYALTVFAPVSLRAI